MKALCAAAMCLAFAASVTAHAGDAKPNVARLRRHAQKLSEACRRKGRTLDDGCLTDPETTGGPYVWDTAPIREDITEGWSGIPYEMRITVVNSTTCEPISGAAIEIWHCTPLGIYSHFIEASVGNGTDTDDRTFLRGVQYTDSDGLVNITSIFPGWYAERATHVHIRVHFNITAEDDDSGYTGGTVGHVGQMFFNDSVVDQLALVSPYSENTIDHTYLADDIHYQAQGGTYGLMTLYEMYAGEGLESGVIGTVTIGVDTLEAEEFDDSILSGGSSPSSTATPSPSTPSPTTPSPSTPSPSTPSPSTPSPSTPSPSTAGSSSTPSPSTDSPSTPSPSTTSTLSPGTTSSPSNTTATDSGASFAPSLAVATAAVACFLML